MSGRDWVAWHSAYEDPSSTLSRRLADVQDQIRLALDRVPPGPVRVVSMCAGQGRDLIGALDGHPRARDVTARLIELDPDNAARARTAGAGFDLSVVEADAGLTDPYLDAVPADVVLACGVYGNITMPDIQRTIALLPGMCAPGATVIWTRHRRQPDQVPVLCSWYAEAGFELVWLSAPDLDYGVGTHRFTGVPATLPPGERLFTFVGRQQLIARGDG